MSRSGYRGYRGGGGGGQWRAKEDNGYRPKQADSDASWRAKTSDGMCHDIRYASASPPAYSGGGSGGSTGDAELDRFMRSTLRSITKGACGDVDVEEVCEALCSWLQSDGPSTWPPSNNQAKKDLIWAFITQLQNFFGTGDQVLQHKFETFAPQLLGMWAKTQASGRGGGGSSGRADNSKRKGDDGPKKQGKKESGWGKSAKSKADPSLVTKMQKCISRYEETGNPKELEEAFGIFEGLEENDTLPDLPSHWNQQKVVQIGKDNVMARLLQACVKAGKIQMARDITELLEKHEVRIDTSAVINIITSVRQQSPAHVAIGFTRRLVELADLSGDEIAFFSRHAVFAIAELMSEAEECYGRIENKDVNFLVAMGHTELDLQMDWKNSSATSITLYNRTGNKGQPTYVPTTNPGFVKSDTALLSFDWERRDLGFTKPYDRIKHGAEVEVTQAQPNSTLTVKIVAPSEVPWQEQGVYRLDKIGKLDQTRRMLDALKIAVSKEESKSKANSLKPHPALSELLLLPTEVTMKERGMPAEKLTDCATLYKAKTELESNPMPRFLNESQIAALQTAVTNRLTLIQGPPGTGKTTTAVQIVSFLIQLGIIDLPMLVTADSNTAVDNLVKGLAKEGIKVLRIGRPESIRDDVKQYALEGQWSELKKAEVVCATCIGSGGDILERYRFHSVLIDECTQAAETACLVPICRGAQHLILIGDQCQLPPTVVSEFCQTEGLGNSLFSRLCQQGVRPTLLDTQYRMHPHICEFPSAAFYNGRLRTGISHVTRPPPTSFAWPTRSLPVCFINVERGEEKREGASYTNHQEAEKTFWALSQLMKDGQLGPDDLGVVTPYSGQVNYIRKLLREKQGFADLGKTIETGSVDGFQGREKDVIVFCAVRANDQGKVGFLSDWRRLNVMLTRAKRGLIVIGHRRTLQEDSLWKHWLTWAQARGCVLNETAKGTWIAKYLVDDEKWVMKSLEKLEEENRQDGGKASDLASQDNSKDDTWETLDNWEDIEC